jgi:hypothetical protein
MLKIQDSIQVLGRMRVQYFAVDSFPRRFPGQLLPRWEAVDHEPSWLTGFLSDSCTRMSSIQTKPLEKRVKEALEKDPPEGAI